MNTLNGAVMCGWLRLCKVFLTDVDRCGVRSCVRPVDAEHVPAGPDEVRAPGPYQTSELRSPDSTSGFPGCGPVQSSSFTFALACRDGSVLLALFLLPQAIGEVR